MTWSEKKKWG